MATGAAKVFEVVVKEKIVQIFSNLRQTLKRTDLMNTRVSVRFLRYIVSWQSFYVL